MGLLIERKAANDTLSFIIRVSNKEIVVKNCHRTSTDPTAMSEGVECYLGNIELNANGILTNVSVCLWIYPDNNCVIVYND